MIKKKYCLHIDYIDIICFVFSCVCATETNLCFVIIR